MLQIGAYEKVLIGTTLMTGEFWPLTTTPIQ